MRQMYTRFNGTRSTRLAENQVVDPRLRKSPSFITAKLSRINLIFTLFVYRRQSNGSGRHENGFLKRFIRSTAY